MSHGIENYFPRLWGTGISNAIFIVIFISNKRKHIQYKKHNVLTDSLHKTNIHSTKTVQDIENKYNTLGKMFFRTLVCGVTGSGNNGVTPKSNSAGCFLCLAGVEAGFTATAVFE